MTTIEDLKNFNYSSIDDRFVKEYFGIHEINNRICIDINRYKTIMLRDGTEEWLPSYFLTTQETFFFPKKLYCDDYVINKFRFEINDLKELWFNEYKPLFGQIKTPNQVYDEDRINAMMYTSNSDDFDDIDVMARMASFKRIPRYNQIIQSLYCFFISKICAEIDRITLMVISNLGYSRTDFDFGDFITFSDGISTGKEKAFSKLRKYNQLNLLHKINNFLKHNTIRSYNDLKKFYPKNVASIENNTSTIEYENGMFAGDWIIIKDGYIDKIFDSLILFYEDYCSSYLKEDIEESKWNYDNYFIEAYEDVRDINQYLGTYLY